VTQRRKYASLRSVSSNRKTRLPRRNTVSREPGTSSRPQPLTVVSATPHHHDKGVLEAWLHQPVNLWPLSTLPRRPFTRQYLVDVTSEIRAAVDTMWAGSRVFFLVTGHAYFNAVAIQALRQRLHHPFVLLVYTDNGNFEPFPTNFSFDLPLGLPQDRLGSTF
jgi:hypothetical protein